MAYESLLRSARRRMHERTAGELARGWYGVAETRPEVIGQHLISAGLDERAIPFLRRAGELANQRSATTEAITHLTAALELLRDRPAGAARDHEELGILLALGAPLTATKGYSAPDVAAIYRRAAALCASMGGETPELFRALYGTWRVQLLRPEYDEAMTIARRLADLAERSGNQTHRAAADRAMGSTLFYLGADLDGARRHLEQVIASDALRASRTRFIDELLDVLDPWTACHAYQAWALWLQGRPAEARAMSDRAMQLAGELGHPFTRALTLCFDAWLCQFEGDVAATHRRAADALALATEQGFGFWIGWAEIMEGWAVAAGGSPADGVAEMRLGPGALARRRLRARQPVLLHAARLGARGRRGRRGRAGRARRRRRGRGADRRGLVGARAAPDARRARAARGRRPRRRRRARRRRAGAGARARRRGAGGARRGDAQAGGVNGGPAVWPSSPSGTCISATAWYSSAHMSRTDASSRSGAPVKAACRPASSRA